MKTKAVYEKVMAVISAVAICTMFIIPVKVSAASSQVSGNLNGFSCYGNLSIDSRNGIAVTTCNRGDVTMRSTVKLYTKTNNSWKVHKGSGYANVGGARAIASITSGAELTQYAKGTHSVSFGAYSWNDNTYVHY